MFIFEQVTGKPFALSNMMDEYLYLYCMILANNPDCGMTFDQLIDCVDDDPSIMHQFKAILEAEAQKQKQFAIEESDGIKKKF